MRSYANGAGYNTQCATPTESLPEADGWNGFESRNQAATSDPNEDSLFAIQGTQTYEARLQPFGVFVVADGMGGHARGDEASNLALHVISNSIVPLLLGNVALGQDALQELLMNSVQRANEVLYQQNLQEGTNMGTTITGCPGGRRYRVCRECR